MVKKIPKSLLQDYDVFITKVQAICKKSPLKVRYITKVRGSNDEVVVKVNDDVDVSYTNKQVARRHLRNLTILFYFHSALSSESKTRAKMNWVRNNSKKSRKYSYRTPRTWTHGRECSSQRPSRLRILQWQARAKLKPSQKKEKNSSSKNKGSSNNSKNKTKTRAVAKIRRRRARNDRECSREKRNAA